MALYEIVENRKKIPCFFRDLCYLVYMNKNETTFNVNGTLCIERKFNKLREALERISDLRKTDDVNWESMSFTAKVIADFALAELEKESK